MNKFWIIVDTETEEPIYDEKGMLLTFPSQEEAQEYMKEHHIHGRVVEFPKS